MDSERKTPPFGGPAEPALITLEVRRLRALLWAVTAAVFLIGVARQVHNWTIGGTSFFGPLRFFALDGEANLPAWYSSSLMLAASGLLVAHAFVSRRHAPRTTGYWWILAVIFVLMSIDEIASFHERGTMLLPESVDLGPFFTFRWVIIAAPLLLAICLAFIPFLRRLGRRDAVPLVIAGVVYVGGAYGFEHVGAYAYATRGAGKAYHTAVFFEEGMEMAGLVLFISALLSQLARQAPRLTIAFGRAPD